MAKTKTTKTETVDLTVSAPVSETAAPVVKNTDSGTVVIALNQPQGIVFRLFKNGSEYKRVELIGNAAGLAGSYNATPLPRGGYGLTTIAAEDWQEIKRQYGELPLFKTGLIFAASGVQNAQAEAAEKSELRNGFEPVDDRETLTSPKE